ncbi:MAG TPA: hypothetical protein VMW34_17460 [Anaerolineales bacterium]|jgi:hypothetical protein|nr:hypothetical protein [Anaerolineales bacterium]
MGTEMNWEYRVESFGGSLSEAKDEDLEEVLNDWNEEGWQLVSAYPIGDKKVRIIAQRPLISSSRRKQRWP